MGCVQSYLSKRSSAYRVDESPDGEQAARQSKRAKAPPAPKQEQPEQQAPPVKQQAQKPAAPARPKLDPKDFMFCNLSGESRVKLPGWASGVGQRRAASAGHSRR
jgi:hypothetical protein